MLLTGDFDNLFNLPGAVLGLSKLLLSTALIGTRPFLLSVSMGQRAVLS